MHVTALLAEDHQLAAGIAQCPCVDGFAASVKIPLLRSARLLSLAVRDVVSSTFFRQEPIYVALASDGSPKSPSALMTRPEVMAGWQRITPDESIPFPDKFTARSILAFSLERPAPLDAAEEAVRRTPLGEDLRVKGGHFDLYAGGIAFEENIKGQLAFLKRVLG
ncbi:hypothetical protein M432DRAFT_638230 [Thermoascus aurantiacus ATCC 26904]